MNIEGKITRLRPARIDDRRKIFEWLTQSDVTPSMMGPPIYPDHPIPSWNAFKQDYQESFFEDSSGAAGKNYIILAGAIEVGTIGFDDLDLHNGLVYLDVWMKAEEFCGHGYGPDALDALVTHLHRTHGVREFRVDPSSRNKRAIKAYQKSGFVAVKHTYLTEKYEYSDTFIMIRRLNTERLSADA